MVKRLITSYFVLFSVLSFAQLSDWSEGKYSKYYIAEDLFEKEKYAASQNEYDEFIRSMAEPNDPFVIKARYYQTLCALELYNNNCVKMVEDFIKDYPENIYREELYFKVGNYFFQKKNYKETIEWLSKLTKFQIQEIDQNEYHFKMGYSYFNLGEYKEARNHFYEVKDKESNYAAPAQYYFSHIAYYNKDYQVALEGFKKLKDDPGFANVVPYYIAQILYLQGKYEELVDYAPGLLDTGKVKRSAEISHLIGDAYYRIEKYDEAVHYLEEYHNNSATTREDEYQLAFAYLKSQQYKNAIDMFNRITYEEDLLTQTAFYQAGEAYLKLGDNAGARAAFESASVMSFDENIKEDALYNYAILSYKLDFNPYDEAIEALNLYLERYPNSKRKKDVYQYLVNVYTTTKNYRAALENLEKFEENLDVKLQTAYQVVAYNRGIQLFQDGNYDASMKILEKVKKYPLDLSLNAQSKYWIAECYYKKREYENAIIAYKEFISEPGARELIQYNIANYNIGYCYFDMQNYESAVNYFTIFADYPEEKDVLKKADSYVKIGDCYYVNRKDELAIKAYRKAVDHGGFKTFNDYALYQVAICQGLLNQNADKIKTLQELVNNYKPSKYSVGALDEIGLTYIKMSDFDNAIRYFDMVLKDYPLDPVAKDAVFHKAIAYNLEKKYKQAEDLLLQILVEQKENKARGQECVKILIDIYTQTGNPEKVDPLLEKYPYVNFDEASKDDLHYRAALEQYQQKEYKKAGDAFEKYLKMFAAPIDEINALYYAGDCHYRLKEYEKALPHYLKLLEKQDFKEITEVSAYRASWILYENKEYEKAIAPYSRLEKVATNDENLMAALIGQMRCAFITEDFQMAHNYGEKVLSEKIQGDVKLEANYSAGVGGYKSGLTDEVLEYLEYTYDHSEGQWGAEALYCHAEIMYKKQDYDNSSKLIKKLVKQKPSYRFWMAKGFILLARNLVAQDDLFQAEATVNSVLKNYTDEEDGIRSEAQTLLNEIQQLKDKPKNIEPQKAPIIEVEGDENNEEGGQNE
ncbi:MAG: tetratricopeptide repeat protein [Crocinitomicaceae bacterium]